MPSPQVGKEKEQHLKAAAAAAEKKEGKEEREAEKKQNGSSSKILKAARADLSRLISGQGPGFRTPVYEDLPPPSTLSPPLNLMGQKKQK